MSSSPTHSSPNAETQTWPVLADVEIDRARPYGRVRQAQLGEILYRPGEVGASCYILLSATVQIVQPSIDGERLITNHCPGTFTGEAGMIAGQRTVVLARVIQGGEVLELRPEDLRTFVARDAGLGEIFLRAFVLRRLLLINRQLGQCRCNWLTTFCRYAAAAGIFGPKWSSLHFPRLGFGRYRSGLSR